MSRRNEIQMTQAEAQSFLDEQRTVICATNGVAGWPHLMPLWFTVRDGDIWCWTYAKSQKVRNLERDPRATLQVEAGEMYHELRGIMIEADTVIHRGLEVVMRIGLELSSRYDSRLQDVVRAQAEKRVGLQFRTRRVVTWDHRKLGDVY
jgi:Pyridoxamine 5'-phosphate oxidase